jgi:aldose 1-epimerase
MGLEDRIRNVAAAVSAVAIVAVPCSGEALAGRGIARRAFGTVGGVPVELFTLTNAKGMQASIATYGGILVALRVPDRRGQLADVVLGHDTLERYASSSPYFGALVGRYGNRIARGRFTLGGRAYTLARNNNGQHLHGGLKGFDKVVWHARPRVTSRGPALTLSYTSKDGEEGYPGTLAVKVTYVLDDRNELELRYRATTDKATPVNLTHHSYFNLAGAGRGGVLGHVLTIHAERFTPVDTRLIPTGELRAVAGTPMDFRRPTAIGKRIGDRDEQLRHGQGYDHNFVLRPSSGPLALAARVLEPKSGRVMEVLTTEPGMQLYSGNFLDGSLVGKGGKRYGRHAGLCLETQHFPDSPNKPRFPSTILSPGKTLKSRTIYRFSTE